MKVLILGSRGMLGSELVNTFSDFDVVGWDREDCDVTNSMAAAMKIVSLKPDLLINAIAYNLVDQAEGEGRDMARKLNAEVPVELAKVAGRLNIPFVHYSTAYVFDGTSSEGYKESDVTNPQGVYASSKLAGEQGVLRAHPGSYVIRLNWLFGKPARSENAKKSFVDKMLTLAEARDSLDLVDDEIGSPTYAPDLAQRTRELLDKYEPGLYHAVNDGICTWKEWAEEAFRLKGVEIDVSPISGKMFKRAAPPPQHSIVVCEKTGPMRHWKEALKEYLT